MPLSLRITSDSRTLWKTGWPYAFLLIILFLFVPMAGLITQFRAEVFSTAVNVLYSASSFNSLALVLMSGLLASAFGITCAWVVTFYRFPLRNVIDWAMILPLCMPPYVMAYVYRGIFGPFGTLDQWFGYHADITNLPVLSVLIAAVLFPYVYTPLRASLRLQSTSLLETARLAGFKSPLGLMRSVLPMHRTAIAGGMLLVALEVLNEYGAPAYFGIPTYTTEIIRTWDATRLTHSISNALIALVFVGLLLAWEHRLRAAHPLSDRFVRREESRLFEQRSFLPLLVCLLPLLVGFIIPVLQMLSWSARELGELADPALLGVAGYTFVLSLSAALVLVLTSIVIGFFNFQFRKSGLSRLTFIANLGYSIPGAIIGIGVLIPVAWLNQQYGILLTGTSFLLIAAYCLRYQAVAFNSVDGTFRKIPLSQHEAAMTLGANRTQSLVQVILPQSKRAVIGALLLVIVDISKELPLTMLFQRFNQETLAVKAFIMMDTEGAFYKASLPSLAIVFSGTLAVVVFRLLDRKSQ